MEARIKQLVGEQIASLTLELAAAMHELDRTRKMVEEQDRLLKELRQSKED